MKYKISEVAKMLGITPEAIRYYEQQNIIKPSKSDSSGYRSYSVWDMHALLHARSYRQYGFTLSETADLINNCDLEDIIGKLQDKTTELEKEAAYALSLVKSIHHMQEIMADAETFIGKYRIEQRPAMYRLDNEDQYVLIKDPQIKKETCRWIEHVPFVFTSARWTKEEYEQGGKKHYFGLCIEEEFADFLPDDLPPYITYLPSRSCVYTVIQSCPSKRLTPQRLQPAIAYMREQGMSLTGDIISRVVNYRKTTDEYVNYHQVWLPFEE
ncbi:helix-turn-helix transcriptional regulator, MerR family [Syntrophotalea carbinolica DSM 2380]|uniref:Helix-turn-helix transcriptional regulator, MerR family n=1 Tax=Syntrophotalea carbinolica (strain DSM 2380 / NBRC 103641 / GraBd1) TaxID=338963 RepID=Q3A2I5_SYNC1|nr:MerR family transcriptional regulator [Syntrophotalea carbinolica]ABA89422.1 helix-turn-helix transcriptional regulator, MerR family [Syntrophotalea carbinolica DSM 2380]